MREARIISIEEMCRIYLRLAAKNVDSGRDSVFDAYRYAYHHLTGMADGLSSAWDFEGYYIARYYAECAHDRMIKGI